MPRLGRVALLLPLAVAAAHAGAASESDLAAGRRLPDLVLVDGGGRPTTLGQVLTGRPRLWLVRVQAEWCGPCLWHAGHASELQERFGGALGIVDVLLADLDNQPASPETVRAWRARVPPTVIAVAHPGRELARLLPPPAPLPWVLVVDAGTRVVRSVLTNPDPVTLGAAVGRVLPTHGKQRPAAEQRVDGLFSRDQWALVADLRLPSRPPPDPTNRVADDPAAAALGRRLFADRTLSPSGRVACESCHDKALVFTNGKDTAAEGVGPGNRNVPSLVLASHARSQLWDGRADSLWSQATLPFEDPSEFGSSRLYVAHAVHARYRTEYEAVFGALPPMDDVARFPPHGGPGDAAFDALPAADREAVSRVLANVGKAIAAFERSLKVRPSPLDRYAGGEHDALTGPQKQGLQAFLLAGCPQCHHGPRLTDDAFHNLRLPTGRQDKRADPGRAAGIPLLLAGVFAGAGPFSDASVVVPRRSVDPTAAEGAFKTPGLRGVPFTMPYGHGGGYGGLASVVEAHRTGGMPPGSRYSAGDAEPWAQGFDPALVPPILEFLQVLRLDVDDP